MTVKMQKAGARPVDVADESVADFKEAGFALCDGEEAPEVATEAGGAELSPEEKQTEIDASGKMAREDAEAKGMTAEAVEEAGTTAEAEATDSLSGE